MTQRLALRYGTLRSRWLVQCVVASSVVALISSVVMGDARSGVLLGLAVAVVFVATSLLIAIEVQCVSSKFRWNGLLGGWHEVDVHDLRTVRAQADAVVAFTVARGRLPRLICALIGPRLFVPTPAASLEAFLKGLHEANPELDLRSRAWPDTGHRRSGLTRWLAITAELSHDGKRD